MNIVSVNWLELLGIWLFGGVMDCIVTAVIYYISNVRYYGRELVNSYLKELGKSFKDSFYKNGALSIYEVIFFNVVVVINLFVWPLEIPKLFIESDKELQEISEQL